MDNPFVLYGYKSPDLFCDREVELSKLNSALENGRNTTLISLRRLGKTGLIKHLFHSLNREKSLKNLLYIDIMSTNNISELVKEFSSALIQSEKQQSKRFLQTTSKLLSGIKAKISFNTITGEPELEFGYKTEHESFNDLNLLFEYIGNHKHDFIIAIDEFQQISNYPERQVEAHFRRFSQEYPDIRFIFSGSSKHILETMFTDSSRPFYQSSELLYLNRIDPVTYTTFIHQLFTTRNKRIDPEYIREWIDILDTYTFYVQYFFNKVFSLGKKNNTYEMMYQVASEIMKERENIFINYKNLLSTNQFKLMKALAKENGVSQPTSSHLIHHYKLNQASSVSTALKALMDKEMIYFENNQYKVYDHFFAMWLQGL